MSVAIRAITRLQDADDINVTLGAGVDEYALTYDHDTAKFVLRAMSAGVTDHGALTGLSDDDHAQYVKKAGDTITGVMNFDTTGVVMHGGTATRGFGFDAGNAPQMVGGAGSITAGGGSLYISAPIQFSNGTAGSPATFFASSTSTGIFRASANGLGIAVAGVEQFRVENGLFGLYTSALTNTVSNLLTLTHDTSGTAAAGFGAGQLFRLESSTTAAQDAARIRALWYEATHATRKADLVLTSYDSGGEREGLRIRGNGSAAALGFLGATPATRQAHVADPSGGATVDAEARSAINSILATLESFGFHATS